MPTIAEIIAAREAAKAKSTNPPAPNQPGKPSSVGLVLSKSTPAPKEETPELPMQPARRSLSDSEGEAIPLTPVDAIPAGVP